MARQAFEGAPRLAAAGAAAALTILGALVGAPGAAQEAGGAGPRAAGAAVARSGAGPAAVRIVAPLAGIARGPTVQLEAEVALPARRALLTVNGASYHVPIEQGRIAQTILAVPGNNRVGLVVEHQGRTHRDSLTFHYEGERIDLAVILTWPSRGEIVDLWVREPGGATCKWDRRTTPSGGRLLDFSADAIGFGSQAYVLPRVRAGRFRIKVHYWGAAAHDDDREPGALAALLERADALEAQARAASGPARASLEAERDEALADADASARPAAPQTPVRAELILFAGTRAERRWRFERTVQRTGQLLTLGEVEISESMIRDALLERP